MIDKQKPPAAATERGQGKGAGSNQTRIDSSICPESRQENSLPQADRLASFTIAELAGELLRRYKIDGQPPQGISGPVYIAWLVELAGWES